MPPVHDIVSDVAPLAGARIETCAGPTAACRSPRGSADRNCISVGLLGAGRSPRGSADRNKAASLPSAMFASRSPRGSADRNIFADTGDIYTLETDPDVSLPSRERGSKLLRRVPFANATERRSPRGSADRNKLRQKSPASTRSFAPLAGARIETSTISLFSAWACRRSLHGCADRNRHTSASWMRR